jgi:hypothetical protein
MFDRLRSFIFSSVFVLLSFFAEWKLGWANIFSCSGAVVTLSGLFLNIKHSLHFHLAIPKENLHYIFSGAAVWGSTPTDDDLKLVDEILLDEIYGTVFMVVGTIIWAYGSYLMQLITPPTSPQLE